MFQDMTSLVIDVGTWRSRIGYGGDDAPLLMPHSYVSSWGESMRDADSTKFQIGDKYLNYERADNEIYSIFSRKGAEGYQFDYQRLNAFLEHNLTKQLAVNPREYSVLFSEDMAAKPQESRQIRQKIAQFFFERLDAPNVFFLKAPVLSCFATGRSSALVVDSGDSFTRSVAVHEGFCLNKSARIASYGGRDVSRQLQRYIENKLGRAPVNKYALNSQSASSSFLEFQQNELLADIKQSLSVRRQEQVGESQITSIEYELPDHQVLNIDRKDFKQGFIWGDESASFKGAGTLATETVNTCDVDIKKQLYSNLLLTGGNLLYGSFVEELVGRVSQSAPANVKVKPVSVCSPNERKYLSWIGGSIVTSLSSFQSYWVGNQEWKQNGATILDKKCN